MCSYCYWLLMMVTEMEFHICFVYSLFVVVGSNQTCRTMMDAVIDGHYLEGYTYENVSSCGFQQCLEVCRKRQECLSINFHASELLCELNTFTTDDKSMLKSMEGYLFKDMNSTSDMPVTGVCQKNTCPEYHECLVLNDNSNVCADRRPVVISESPVCPTTYPYVHFEDAGVCLLSMLHLATMFRDMADMLCSGTFEGQGLAIVDDENKLAAIGSLMGTTYDYTWIDGTKVGGKFKWSNGEELVTQPGPGAGKDCLVVARSGANYEIRRENCDTMHPYICESRNN